MNYRYPVYQPELSGNEKEYVNHCLDTQWISSKGEYVNRFESNFASYIGVSHATAVCNGTVALHLALLALGLGEGDEVLVPTLTYIASVNAISYTGAKPVFVDSRPDTWQIEIEELKSSISNRTKAILAVHLYGHPCDMNKLRDLAREHGLYLIEDSAEALGSEFEGQKTGSFGDIATFSFYGNKTITTGEGGMVVTNDETLYRRVNHFKGQGLAQFREYWHDIIGYNYRMTNICAAIGLAQLERVQETLEEKKRVAQTYMQFFEGSIIEYHKQQPNVYHSYWMFSILVPKIEDREPLRTYLRDNGIDTRPLFYPVHTMPMYAKGYKKFPVAEELGWRGINLPSYPGLTQEDIRFIATEILNYFK